MNNFTTEYDSDFDEKSHEDKKTSFDQLSPKLAFWGGFIISILGAGTISFFVVLVLYLKL